MNELVTVIMEQAAIWMPSLAAILGIVGTIITCLGKLKAEIEKLKGEDYQTQLKESNDALRAQISSVSAETQKAIEDMTEQTKSIVAENLALKKANRLLIEDLRRVKNHDNEI